MRRKLSCWRDAGRRLTVFGVPAPLLLIYLAWGRWPSFTTIWVCTGILIAFAAISYLGWTPGTLFQRAVYLLRGNKKSGRPWWYRQFFE